MSVRLIGAGLGRTGTTSLWKAAGLLFGAPCYNMKEFMHHPEHASAWHCAARDGAADWQSVFNGYAAVVDWPAASFWYEIAEAFPDALIVLTLRDAESWWESADQTIFERIRSAPANPILAAVEDVFEARFTMNLDDAGACKAAFDAHYVDVRRRAPADRLLEWHPGEGWEPLCRRLGVTAPDTPFPHTNTRREFIEDTRRGDGNDA